MKVLGGTSKSLFDGAFILVQKTVFEFLVSFIAESMRAGDQLVKRMS